ncbi:hypothetical protein PCANC_07449 [Puccinia coronata f. sp. avenae]|uniref:Uncharacterized protein n=1 Tax=Puccinia coronata f. sp. avenae TaxID=200324 RepID=A0A2N5T414_9BASI|nr:hypothetical protein PCANC_07449 [Puccinia coronata f. sp. avenae]
MPTARPRAACPPDRILEPVSADGGDSWALQSGLLLRPSEGSLQDSQRIQLKAQTDIMYSFSSQSDFDGQIVKTSHGESHIPIPEMMKVFLALLLILGTIWTCEAFCDASHSNYPHDHPSSTNTPAYTSSSNSHHDQLDSSIWGMPEANLGSNHFGYNLHGWNPVNADASCSVNQPSYSVYHPGSTGAHGVLEPGISYSFSFDGDLQSANDNTPWHHQFESNPVPNAPSNSYRRPTGSKKLKKPKVPLSSMLKPHGQSILSSTEPATSFGLPIPRFTKKFLKKAGESSKLHHENSIEKLQTHLKSLGEEQPVVLNDDTNFYKFCEGFHLIKPTQGQNKAGMTYNQTSFFLNEREVITLILPPMKMEGLDARFQWYAKLANTISNRPKSQEDHQLQKLAESFPFTKPTTPQAVNATLWKFVAAWARKYRPRMLLTVRKEKPKSGTGCYKLYQRNIL